jgi:hypothetical protein
MAKLRYWLKVTRCDNELTFTTNGHTFYHNFSQLNPLLHDRVEFTDRLQPHPYVNRIYVTGANALGGGDNPYKFEYEITKTCIAQGSWESRCERLLW